MNPIVVDRDKVGPLTAAKYCANLRWMGMDLLGEEHSLKMNFLQLSDDWWEETRATLNA